jgi:hypothetical protein
MSYLAANALPSTLCRGVNRIAAPSSPQSKYWTTDLKSLMWIDNTEKVEHNALHLNERGQDFDLCEPLSRAGQFRPAGFPPVAHTRRRPTRIMQPDREGFV